MQQFDLQSLGMAFALIKLKMADLTINTVQNRRHEVKAFHDAARS